MYKTLKSLLIFFSTYYSVLTIILQLISPFISYISIYIILGFYIIPIPFIAIYFFIKKKNKNNFLKGKYLLKKLEVSLKKAFIYLRDINKDRKTGLRYRINKLSIIETSTVESALILISKTLNLDYKYDINIFLAVFKYLKNAFNGKVDERFPCYGCKHISSCNIIFFDNLSHFLYLENVEPYIFNIFKAEFKYIVKILENRLLRYDDMMGWSVIYPLHEKNNPLDPFCTATNLILYIKLNEEKNIDIEVVNSIINFLIKSQNDNGGWKNKIESAIPCNSSIPIITTHRVIEALLIGRNFIDNKKKRKHKYFNKKWARFFNFTTWI